MEMRMRRSEVYETKTGGDTIEKEGGEHEFRVSIAMQGV